MLHNDIWQSIARDNERLCCMCLEKRLNRQLEISDLLPCAMNNSIYYFTDILLNQLSKYEEIK